MSELDAAIEIVNGLSHYEMARLFRFAPAGSPYFISGTPACEAFYKRWKELGGWNPALSKQVGWDK